MSEIQHMAEGAAPAADSLKNPSYPQREHIHERARWDAVLKASEERIAAARQKLGGVGDSQARPSFDRLYAQMLGARDQIAAAARRMPGEAGVLYHEDKHRLEEAVAALDRVFQQWDAHTV